MFQLDGIKNIYFGTVLKKKIIKNLSIIIFALLIISLVLTIKLSFFQAIKLVYGSMYIFFLPGFLISYIFLKKLDLIERIIISIALSFSVIPLIIYYFNILGVRFTLINTLFIASGINIISLGIIYYRSRNIIQINEKDIKSKKN